VLFVTLSFAQQKVSLHNAQVIPLTYLGETEAYSKWDANRKFANPIVRSNDGVLVPHEELEGKGLHKQTNPNALPQGVDPALQKGNGTRAGANRSLDLSFDGMTNSGVSPADPCLDVGPNHVIEMINGPSGAYFEIFDKSGNSLGPQVYLDNFTGSVGGLGDPIVLYDALVDRWLMSEFSSSGNQLLVAVSTTADPTGTWNAFAFTAPQFPDYPKYSVWQDMYMVTSNEGGGSPLYALDRTKILAGDPTATAQRFTTPDYPTIGFQATTPITFDNGTPPPANAPATLMRMADDAWSATIPNDRLEIWTLSVDFNNQSNSVLSGPDFLATQPFDTELCGFTSFSCIQQPGTGTRLDPLREVIMNRAQYRNMGSHEVIVCNHVTDVDGTDRAGIRWYELRRTGGPTQPWTIYQQGTYSPDSDSRWMAGIAINDAGDIGLAYSVSSSTTNPSLRFTGRNASDPLGTMPIAETSIVAGTSFNSSNRWGDYFSLDSDPSTGSFWGVGCYNTSTAWDTRIYEFSFAPSVPDYSVDLTAAGITVCQPANGTYTIQVGSVLGYSDPVTLSVTGLPAGVSAAFSTNPVTPAGTSTLTLSNTGAATPGAYTFDLNATSTAGPRTILLSLDLLTSPGGVTNTAPADASTNVSGAVLTWTADPVASEYEVDIATDAAFTNVVETASGITGTSYTATANQPTTTYYWRVRSLNDCGMSGYSNTWSYTTAACSPHTVSILLDRYGAETTWSLTDASGAVAASGGPYVTQATNGEYPEPDVNVCLVDGCYSFEVLDSFGDGICCAFGNGAISVSNSGGILGTADVFTDAVSFNFEVGSSSSSCIDPNGFSDDLESISLCGATWNNVGGDDFDWTYFTGSTTSNATGPSGDHTTGSGFYYYTETSTPVNFGDVAFLESSCIDIAGTSAIDVSFWFHMWGAEIGTLELQGLEGGTWNTFWSLSGDQGDVWTQTTVNIPTNNGLQQIRFRAEVGTLGNSWQNDFAIDDIQISVVTSEVQLAADLFLEGPYDGAGTMNDAMRVAGLLPLTEPYTTLGYGFVGGGGEQITDPAVLSATGVDAIVDWVVVELRDENDNSTIVASRSALLQRDGDVVDVDGVSDVNIAVSPGNYFVAVRHRNHLGTMAVPAVALSGAPTDVDLTSGTTAVFGTNARKDINGTQVLWMGDVSSDGVIRYTGANNDRDQVLVKIGGSVPTATLVDYSAEDVNLDAIIKYTGANNDRDPILVNIGGSVPTAILIEQLP